MRQARTVALIAVVAALFCVLLNASLGDSLRAVAATALVLYAFDYLLMRSEPERVQRQLRQVGADSMWRAFYRQVLVVVFLLRDSTVSHATVAIVVVAVIAHHLLVTLNSGLNMVVQRKRERRIETRNLPVPGAELPAPLPPWLTVADGRFQMHTELILLAGLVWAASAGSTTPIGWAAAMMVAVAALFPICLLPQLVTLAKMADDDTRLAAAQVAVLALRPTVILYFSGGLNAVYQVNMWFETLERLDRPALVLLRERRYLSRLQESNVPVLCLPYTRDVMNFDFTGARVALYVANVGRNIHFLRIPTLRSAFIGHGDSDKVASFNPYSKVYDEVWVAGEAGRERYVRAAVGVGSEQIVVVGRPQLDHIRESVPRPPGAAFTVLYAPTWEGWTDDVHASSITEMGSDIIQVLLAEPGVRVLYKPHPLTGTVRPEARTAHDLIMTMIAAAGPPHTVVSADEMTLYQCFDESDALISDISSVVSDYLRSEKPYFVTNGADVADADFRVEYPSAGAAYLVGPHAAGLRAGVAEARGPDRQRANRQAVRRYLLGDPDVESISLFRQAVDNLAAEAAHRLRVVPEDKRTVMQSDDLSELEADESVGAAEQ